MLQLDPALKKIHLLWPLPSVGMEAFRHWWITEHAPLLATHRGDRGQRRYVQNHADPDTEQHNMAVPLVGFTMSWWDDAAAAVEVVDRPDNAEVFAMIHADSGRYVDRSRSGFVAVQEHLVLGGRSPARSGPTPARKVVSGLRRAPGVSEEDFRAWWTTERSRRVVELAPGAGLGRYLQSVPLVGATGSLSPTHTGVDGFEEWWFPDGPSTAPGMDTVRGLDADPMLDASRTWHVAVTEYVYFDELAPPSGPGISQPTATTLQEVTP